MGLCTKGVFSRFGGRVRMGQQLFRHPAADFQEVTQWIH
jgi:hypothetical protein